MEKNFNNHRNIEPPQTSCQVRSSNPPMTGGEIINVMLHEVFDQRILHGGGVQKCPLSNSEAKSHTKHQN